MRGRRTPLCVAKTAITSSNVGGGSIGVEQSMTGVGHGSGRSRRGRGSRRSNRRPERSAWPVCPSASRSSAKPANSPRPCRKASATRSLVAAIGANVVVQCDRRRECRRTAYRRSTWPPVRRRCCEVEEADRPPGASRWHRRRGQRDERVEVAFKLVEERSASGSPSRLPSATSSPTSSETVPSRTVGSVNAATILKSGSWASTLACS